MTIEIPEIQKKIDELQNSYHDQVDELMIERDLKRNDIYAKRTEILKAQGPKNFWSVVIQAHADIANELTGSYDGYILDKLQDFSVVYTREGYKLSMKFEKNDYFEDTELWVADVDGEMQFSGIKWRDGKGPLTEEEEEQHQKTSKGAQKRDRDERGPSLFEVFSEMPPHPEEDEELEEEDDEEIEELAEEWEEDLEDRKEVLACLVEEVWADPAQILAQLASEPAQ